MNNTNVPDELISSEEAQELQLGSIERTGDTDVNTAKDLLLFLDEQIAQAKKILTRQAVVIWKVKSEEQLPPTARAVLQNRIADVEKLGAKGKELTLSSLREACSILSDIVGFNVSVKAFEVTEYGNAESNRAGRLFGDETPQLKHRKQEMMKLTANAEALHGVLKILEQHGGYEYIPLNNKKGPVLVFMPEIHYDSEGMKDDYDVVMKAWPYISLYASKGFSGELRKKADRERQEHFREEMNNNRVAISVVAAETVLGDKLFTLGIENDEELQTILNTVFEKASAEFTDKKLNQFEVLVREKGITREEFLRMAMKGMDEYTKRVTVGLRNSTWLKNIQDACLQRREDFGSNSNIVFLTAGAVHVPDMKKRADEYGFGGMVIFVPEAFDKLLDVNALRAYKDLQP